MMSGYKAMALLALQRFDEIRQGIQHVPKAGGPVYLMHATLYALGFLDANSTAMAEQQRWFAGQRDYEHMGFALASDTEMYAGRVTKARELTQEAVESAIRGDSKESAAIWLENTALGEAAYGNISRARQEAASGLKLASDSQAVESEAALAFAIAGERSLCGFRVANIGFIFCSYSSRSAPRGLPAAPTSTAATSTLASSSRSHAGGTAAATGARARSVVSLGTSRAASESVTVSTTAARDIPTSNAVRSPAAGAVACSSSTSRPVTDTSAASPIAGQIAALPPKLLAGAGLATAVAVL
jgi:hypothetical protein